MVANEEGQWQLAQVPAAQLDLSDSSSDQNADHLTAYRELMYGDNEQEIVEGALIDRLVIVTDGNGNTVFETDEDPYMLKSCQ